MEIYIDKLIGMMIIPSKKCKMLQRGHCRGLNEERFKRLEFCSQVKLNNSVTD